MTNTSMLADIAESLDNAERGRTAISPLTESTPDLSVEDAYAIQAAWLERRLAHGAGTADRLVGRKVGLTNRAMQRQLGVDEPDFGFLLQSMLRRSGATLVASELIQPRVEPEIAFWLERPLRGPGITRADVLAATHGVSAALEIVDSRIADWRIKLVDTIADNGSSSRAVISEQIISAADLDLGAETVRLFTNDNEVGLGSGADVLGHPAEAVAWLANCLADFDSQLDAGHVVLPGAMCASVFAHAGEMFRAEFAHLGAVEVRFA